MDRNGLPAAVALGAPDLIHELDARENFAGVRKKLVEQEKFLLRQLLHLVTAADSEGVVIERHVADGADGGLGSVVARGHGAKDLMPGGTHAAHEDGPEIGSGAGLIAQDEYFHGISFAHLSGGYAP